MTPQESFFRSLDGLGLTDAQHAAITIAGTEYAGAERLDAVEDCFATINNRVKKQIAEMDVAGWNGIVFTPKTAA